MPTRTWSFVLCGLLAVTVWLGDATPIFNVPTAALDATFTNITLGLDHIIRLNVDVRDYVFDAEDLLNFFVRLDQYNPNDRAGPRDACFLTPVNVTGVNFASTGFPRPLRINCLQHKHLFETRYHQNIVPVYGSVMPLSSSPSPSYNQMQTLSFDADASAEGEEITQHGQRTLLSSNNGDELDDLSVCNNGESDLYISPFGEEGSAPSSSLWYRQETTAVLNASGNWMAQLGASWGSLLPPPFSTSGGSQVCGLERRNTALSGGSSRSYAFRKDFSLNLTALSAGEPLLVSLYVQSHVLDIHVNGYYMRINQTRSGCSSNGPSVASIEDPLMVLIPSKYLLQGSNTLVVLTRGSADGSAYFNARISIRRRPAQPPSTSTCTPLFDFGASGWQWLQQDILPRPDRWYQSLTNAAFNTASAPFGSSPVFCSALRNPVSPFALGKRMIFRRTFNVPSSPAGCSNDNYLYRLRILVDNDIEDIHFGSGNSELFYMTVNQTRDNCDSSPSANTASVTDEFSVLIPRRIIRANGNPVTVTISVRDRGVVSYFDARLEPYAGCHKVIAPSSSSSSSSSTGSQQPGSSSSSSSSTGSQQLGSSSSSSSSTGVQQPPTQSSSSSTGSGGNPYLWCPSSFNPAYFLSLYPNPPPGWQDDEGYQDWPPLPRYPSRPGGLSPSFQWPVTNPSTPRPPAFIWPLAYPWPPVPGFAYKRPSRWPSHIPWPPVNCQYDTIVDKPGFSACVEIDLPRVRLHCPSRVNYTVYDREDVYNVTLSVGLFNNQTGQDMVGVYTTQAIGAVVSAFYTFVTTTPTNNPIVASIKRAYPVPCSPGESLGFYLEVAYLLTWSNVANDTVFSVDSPAIRPHVPNCYRLRGVSTRFIRCNREEATCEAELVVQTHCVNPTPDGLIFQAPCLDPISGHQTGAGAYNFDLSVRECTVQTNGGSGPVVETCRVVNETLMSNVLISVFPTNSLVLKPFPRVGFLGSYQQSVANIAPEWDFRSHDFLVATTLPVPPMPGDDELGSRLQYDVAFAPRSITINGESLFHYSNVNGYYPPRLENRVGMHDIVCSGKDLNCDAFGFTMPAISSLIRNGAPFAGRTLTIRGDVLLSTYLPIEEDPTGRANTSIPARRLLAYEMRTMEDTLEIGDDEVKFVAGGGRKLLAAPRQRISYSDVHRQILSDTRSSYKLEARLDGKRSMEVRVSESSSMRVFAAVTVVVIVLVCIVGVAFNRYRPGIKARYDYEYNESHIH